MVYAPHMRLTIRGEFRGSGGVLEQYSMGLNLLPVAGQGPQPTDAHLANCVEAVDDFWRDPNLAQTAENVVTEVKIAPIGPDGRYAGDPLVAAVSVPGAVAGQDRRYPLQIALAVTLRTPRRGASGRGRFYLPAPQRAMDGTARLTVADAQGVRDAVASFIRDLAATETQDPAGLLGVQVASSKGFNSPVTAVTVGRVLDTVRSRRTSLAEVYVPTVEPVSVVPLPD